MYIKKFLKDWSNFLAFGIGLIPTILLYIFPSSTKVPFFAFALLLFSFILVLWLCIKFYLSLKEHETSPAIPIIECSNGVCICKTNDFISYNSIVSFYERIGNYEKIIGYGYVETIISGKTAQIKTIPNDSPTSDLISYINDNKSNIIIRPTITIDTLNELARFID